MSACSILAGREVLARRAAMRHRRQKMRHHTPLREAAYLSRKMTFETVNSARGMLTTGCRPGVERTGRAYVNEATRKRPTERGGLVPSRMQPTQRHCEEPCRAREKSGAYSCD